MIEEMLQSTAASLLKSFEASEGGSNCKHDETCTIRKPHQANQTTPTHLKVQTLLVPSATKRSKPNYPRLRRYFLIHCSSCHWECEFSVKVNVHVSVNVSLNVKVKVNANVYIFMSMYMYLYISVNTYMYVHAYV